MNDILRIAHLRIALQRAFLGRAIVRVIDNDTQFCEDLNADHSFAKFVNYCCSGFEGYFADRRPADFISC